MESSYGSMKEGMKIWKKKWTFLPRSSFLFLFYFGNGYNIVWCKTIWQLLYNNVIQTIYLLYMSNLKVYTVPYYIYVASYLHLWHTLESHFLSTQSLWSYTSILASTLIVFVCNHLLNMLILLPLTIYIKIRLKTHLLI